MWTTLVAEIPEYFWIGKGYRIDATDLFLVEWKQHFGYAQDYEWAVVTGEYHNGPLSLIIPLGIVGTLAYVAFWLTCLRYLWNQRKHGPPELWNINTGLLAIFLARIFFFVGIHGGAAMDLVHLTGIIGLSVAINGVRRTVPAAQPLPAATEVSDNLLTPTPALSR